MNKMFLHIADSDILSNKINQKIYSILGICGSNADIQNLVALIGKVLENLNITSIDSVAGWVENEDNISRFLEIMNTKTDLPNLRLSCLVSNHNFAIMLSYIKAITGSFNINTPEIAHTMESIYPDFEKKCIPLFPKVMDLSIAEEIFVGLKRCLSSSQETKGKSLLLKSFLPIHMQYNNVKELNEKLFPEMSMSDYIQYVNILKKLNNDCQISEIYASEHANVSLRKSITVKSIVEQSDVIVDINAIHLFGNDKTSQMFAKLIAINDYAWNRLSIESTPDNLSDNEKYLIMALWILFMGDYSSWMLSNLEYKRLATIFEELRHK